MTIWGIADIHASPIDPDTGLLKKPMDIFGPDWRNHVDRLEESWRSLVSQGDTVLIAGDIDWSVRLEDALETLYRIDSWPGTKILGRGNHDYWWSSKSTNRVRDALPPSLYLIHNNSIESEGFNVCGAKGSPVPGGMDWSDRDAKLLNRETQRLAASLQARNPSLKTIAMIHYPPFYPHQPSTPYRLLIEQASAGLCIYGHLHGDASQSGPSGLYSSVNYVCVAIDAVNFEPVPLARDGRLLVDKDPHRDKPSERRS